MPIISRPHHASRAKRLPHTLSATFAALLLPLTAAQAADLPEVNVKASTENDFKAERAASAKYSQPLLDTPQTISVIKRELIEQQAAHTLTDALRNTPGVGAFFLGENGSTSTGDAIYMRGFDTSGSIFVDGVRDIGSISRDLFNIEQIDILKGSAGTDSGRSAPTGSINLNSKQAQLDNAGAISMSVGSAKQKRISADINRILDEASGTALRLNLLDQDSGVAGRDVVRNQRWAVAPTLSFGLASPTRVILSYLHVEQNNIPDGGVPTIGLPGYTSPDPTRPVLSQAAAVDSNNFYGVNSDHDQVRADMFTARIEHDFSPTVRLINTTRYGKTAQNYLLTAFMGSSANALTPVPSDTSGWTLARSIRTQKDQQNEIFTNQSNLSAELNWGGFKQTLLGGLELTQEKQNTWGYDGLGSVAAANLYHPNPADPVSGLNLQRNGVFTRGSTSTVSAYLFDTIEFSPRWQVNGGLRIDRYDTDYSSASLSTAKTNPTLPINTLVPLNLNTAGNLLNWKLGALYKPTTDSSVYASMSTSKQAPGGANFALSLAADNAGNPKFDPQVAKNYEIGGKWDLLEKKLSFTAAVYRTDISNDIVQNLVDLLYYQTGAKRVQGLELGMSGEIRRNWLVSAGYARMNTSVASGPSVTANGETNLAYAPKQTFTVWTSYELPMGLKLGGGARFVDALLRGKDGALGTPVSTDPYWVFDSMLNYAINKNVALQLNVYNLSDRRYVASINKSGYRYAPGTPRSATLALNIKF
ncbi:MULTISPECIES: catecholate siderophore receptor Fiu [unclassified Undibacterium]|uniref:catecholate siderophore receptor Fiu n=1 Tax=unclassified Undibacterium TaxID=2630295 RepID=UPI002AC8C908|nr:MULTISPECIES: catecholate siderophore receptor Fiu [unclassified Undibacterium]MEB0140012.1 catecholate siderophore receptor Fiu [Undibacterium sp. CCC2.1]MEB0173032.1 catecholate siderophore receptor Fiu [Undibacterium sp. CCC1.1]MEB0176814.1 catecholate siderophore receptor Fiu [Undibacterium sp. CCC3.4]MEB0216046.1 catecholate siderophore receptor Fiu [Undibacterium sp. 5I2]WPX42194.1 catecholate siderophore receptor Fiu [Undibacterium sp. CCC3.4]